MDTVVETKDGGKQSHIDGLPTLLPVCALKAMSATMKRGGRYGIQNWHKIPVVANARAEGETADAGELDHALMHYFDAMLKAGCGETFIEDLTHFACRAVMGLDQYIRHHPDEFKRFMEEEGK